MKRNEIIKLNNEILDSVYSFFKGAEVLISDEQSNYDTIYAYLLLQATGIERLQKIVYVIDFYNKNSRQLTDKELKTKLGHKILDIHKEYFYKYFKKTDTKYIEKVLDILSKLVNVKEGYRYANFDFHNNEIFDIRDHLVKILEGLPSEHIEEHEIFSLQVIHEIIKKYIAVLIKLIWRKEVGSNDIIPICFQDYVTKGLYEIDIDDKVNKIIVQQE